MAASSEFFISVQDRENQVLTDVEVLDFGFLQHGRVKKDTIRMTNRTNAKVGHQRESRQATNLSVCRSVG